VIVTYLGYLGWDFSEKNSEHQFELLIFDFLLQSEERERHFNKSGILRKLGTERD